MLKILKHLKKYKWYMLAAVSFIAVQSIGELLLPGRMQKIIDEGIMYGDNDLILSAGTQMLVISAVVSLSAVTASFLISVASSGFAKNLRRAVFVKVTGSTAKQSGQFGTASLITRTTNDVTQLQQVMVMSRMMFMTPIMGIGSVVMALINVRALSWIMAVVAVIIALLLVLVLSFSTPLFKIVQSKIDRLNHVLREKLTGVRVIRAFNRIDRERENFDNANKDLTGISLKVSRIMAVLMPATTLIMNAAILFVTWISADYIDRSVINIGQMSAFIQYIMHTMMSMMFATMVFTLLPRAGVSAERINAVLESESEISDSGVAAPAKARTGLEFRNVTFRFPGAENPVLKNISFTARPGEMTAIIGSTGSGKSTLIELIPRFYDVESGEILLNGQNITDISIQDLRHKIGLVPQKAVLFSGTVAENIRYGKEDATDAEVETAARTAMAYDFIMSKPEGFEQAVSQGGANFSGGQKQRLSIARALVRRPEVYIFDDSFSALDFKTDAALRAKLRETVTDSVMLIVAQRVSSIMDAARIIVLSNGEIVGNGRHKELLKSCEVYKEIVLSQLSEEEIA